MKKCQILSLKKIHRISDTVFEQTNENLAMKCRQNSLKCCIKRFTDCVAKVMNSKKGNVIRENLVRNIFAQ